MSRTLQARIGALALAAQLLVTLAAQAQEHVRLAPQLGTSTISAVAFSPDGRFAVTAGGFLDKTARLWDVATGKQIRTFVGHTGSLTSVAISPDGKSIATGSMDHTARTWDTATGDQIRVFKGHTDAVTAVAISPDGRFLLTGSLDNGARLWDVATGDQILSLSEPNGFIAAVAFSPNGRFVVTGGEGYVAWLWDAFTGQPIRSFKGPKTAAISADSTSAPLGDKSEERNLGLHYFFSNIPHQFPELTSLMQRTSWVNSVAFSPDGREVLTGGTDNVILLWDAATGQQVRAFEGHTGAIGAVAFSPDGRDVLSGSSDKSARIWDAVTGQQILALDGHTNAIASAEFSPDGHSVLTGSLDESAKLWDASTGKQIRTFAGNTSSVHIVAFSPNGRLLITGHGSSGSRAWDLASGGQIPSFKETTGYLGPMAISPDGHSVVVGGSDTPRLLDIATGKQIQSFKGSSKAASSLAFSPDGRFVLSGDVDKGAILWEVATGQQIRSYVGSGKFVNSVAFSPDGRYILTGTSDDKVRMWDATNAQEIRSFGVGSGFVRFAAFSPDGRSVLTPEFDGAVVLDITSGQRTCSMEGAWGAAMSAAFSPDGRSVALGSGEGTVYLWDPTACQQTGWGLTGHTGEVLSVAFSPDGRFVLSGSNDTTTRLWDSATGKQLATLLSFDSGGWAVTDPSGRYDSNDPDNTPGLVWVTDSNRVIELKQLKDSYYTPNLLASIIKGERLPDVKGLDQVPAPPEVGMGSAYKPESRLLTLSIAGQGGGVGRLVVSVNDRVVAKVEHPVAEGAAKKAGKTEVTVDLSGATLRPGENTITAYAFDAGNQIRSHEAKTTFAVATAANTAAGKGFAQRASDAMSADYKPQFYGIVVGTASFAGNHKMDLAYPAHDAQSMMTGLEIGADKLFGKENVHLRLLTTDSNDEAGQPTKRNIAAAFAEVKKEATPMDVLLVYLSGHGVNLRTERDSYYYLTTDARSLDLADNPELRDLSTVNGTELKQWMGAKDMPLKEVLILDTCAAGAASEELAKLVEKREVPPDQRRAIEFLKDTTGTIILMGSAADRVSYEASKYGQGLLTYALLSGMHGRSVASDSTLEVSHWFQNASEDVPMLAQSIGGIQKPVIAMPSGTGFPVARLEPSDQALIPLATIKPELLHLTCHDDHDHDPLGLAALIRERLRDISHPVARGTQSEPPIIYHDDMTDGPADALTPKIIYKVSEDRVELTLRIDQGDNTVKETPLAMSGADKKQIADKVAAMLVEMAGQTPVKSSSQ